MKAAIGGKLSSTRKVFLACGAIFTLGVLMTFDSTPAKAGEAIEIKAATFHPIGHYLTSDAYKRFGEEVEKRTNGKVKFKWFFAGSLAKGPQLFDAVENGIADMAFAGLFDNQKMPITSWLELPFVVDSAKHGSDVAWDVYQNVPEMRAEFKNFKVLGFFLTSTMQISALTPPMKTLEDLIGKRIATVSASGVVTLKYLGASPQQMPATDVYMAAQRNMLDGVMFPLAPLRSYKLTDLLANHTICSLRGGINAIVMYKNTWNKLPPDVQNVFDDLGQSVGSLCGETLTNESAWVLEELKARGDKVYYLPGQEKARWREKLNPIYEEWIAKVKQRGLDGKAIFDKAIIIAAERRISPYKPDPWWGNAGRKRAN